MSAMAGNTSPICPAKPGWRSTYSLSEGRSPARQRARNSSANSSTSDECDGGEDMGTSLRLPIGGGHRLQQLLSLAPHPVELQPIDPEDGGWGNLRPCR